MKNKLILTFLILAIFLSCGGKKSHQDSNLVDESPIASFDLSIYLEKDKINPFDFKFFQQFKRVNFNYFEYETGLRTLGKAEGIFYIIQSCNLMMERYKPIQVESCVLNENDQAIFCNKVHSKGLRKLRSDRKYSLCVSFKSDSYDYSNFYPFVIEEHDGELYRYYSAVEKNNFDLKYVVHAQIIHFGSEKKLIGPYIEHHLGKDFVATLQSFFKLE